MNILGKKLCTNQLATKGGGKQAFESHYLGWELGLETQTTSGIHFFLWLSLHNSVPVCELSGSIGLNLHTGCSIVNESIVHVLDNCFFLWDAIGLGFNLMLGNLKQKEDSPY